MKGKLVFKHGKYYVIVDLGKDATGKRQQKWVPTGKTTLREAEAKMPGIMQAAYKNEIPKDSKLTLSKYLDQWLEVYCKPNLRPATYKSYEWSVNDLKINLGKTELVKLTPVQIQQYYSKKLKAGLSPSSVRARHSTLSEALKHAVKWQLLGSSPCKAVEAPRKPKYVAQVYSPLQLQLLLTIVADTTLELPIVLAVTCGLRRGEVCGLRWQDIDFDNTTAHIIHNLDWNESKLQLFPVKTDRSNRPLKLPEMTINLLRLEKVRQDELKIKTDFVWAWDDGRPYDPDYLYKNFKKVIRRHNESIQKNEKLSDEEKKTQTLPDIRFHDLRHSHATILLISGVNAKIVSERLGHSRTSFTQDVYQHVLPHMQDGAASAIDEMFKIETEDSTMANGHSHIWPTLMQYYKISKEEAQKMEEDLNKTQKRD